MRKTARWTGMLGLGLLLAACSPADGDRLASLESGLEINVPGDYPTIQQAIDASSAGDTILVGPGEYTENPYPRSGIAMRGAGPDLTVLRGQMRFWGETVSEFSGFRVVKQGSSGLDADAGIIVDSNDILVHDNLVEGFGIGIWVTDIQRGHVTANVSRQNDVGMEVEEAHGLVYVMNNLILNNPKIGIVVEGQSYDSATFMNNTIVGNGFGETFENGGAGVVTREWVMCAFLDNIIVSNHAGMNLYSTDANCWRNLVWGNVVDYLPHDPSEGEDIHVDPKFVDPANKNYRLRFDSPAIDKSTASGFPDVDFDGNPRPAGAMDDLGAFEYQAVEPEADLIVTEVMANPLDEARGEYVELYNPTASGVEAAGLVLSDGDSTDTLVAFGGGPTVVPAGGYALVMDQGYPDIAEAYDIPPGTVLLTVPNAALGSGLAISDPVELTRGGAMVSSYFHPFNPGNGISTERVDPQGPDSFENWVPCPCGASPGRDNCISSGGPPAGPALVVTEVMANPAVQSLGEFVEVYNADVMPIELTGLVLDDGDSTDVLVAAAGKASLLGPGEYGVIIDSDLVPQMEGPPYGLDATVPVVVTVANAALGNGLASTDPISLFADDGQTLLSTFSHPMANSAQSVERIDSAEADLASNWMPSPCVDGHSAGRQNCASGGGDPGSAPDLLINEVMANPIDEDTGEFIEILNQDTQPVDAAGLVLSDGDATDVIIAFPGETDTTIPAGGYGLILDPEYAGEYAIAPGTVLLAPANTTLGNSLSTNDPITLFAADGVTVVSTCANPSNPGNGISLERLGQAADVPSNWAASSCGASPGAHNCSDPNDPDPVTAELVLSEVMANAVVESKGEFVEITNTGVVDVDLAGYVLSDGDASDTIEGYLGGPTLVPAGAIAVVLDQSYVDIAEPYTIPAGAVLLTTDDATVGSGLSTDDPVTLLEPDGVTVVSTFSSPFNPGDGISAERVDLGAPDTPANWVASPCPSGSSPGDANCGGI